MIAVVLPLIVLSALPMTAQVRKWRLHLLYWSGAAALFIVNLIALAPIIQTGERAITLSHSDVNGAVHTTRYVISQGYFSSGLDFALFGLGLVVWAQQKWGALIFRRMTRLVFWLFYGAAVLSQLGAITLSRPGKDTRRYADYVANLERFEVIYNLALIMVYLSLITFAALLILSVVRRLKAGK